MQSSKNKVESDPTSPPSISALSSLQPLAVSDSSSRGTDNTYRNNHQSPPAQECNITRDHGQESALSQHNSDPLRRSSSSPFSSSKPRPKSRLPRVCSRLAGTTFYAVEIDQYNGSIGISTTQTIILSPLLHAPKGPRDIYALEEAHADEQNETENKTMERNKAKQTSRFKCSSCFLPLVPSNFSP